MTKPLCLCVSTQMYVLLMLLQTSLVLGFSVLASFVGNSKPLHCVYEICMMLQRVSVAASFAFRGWGKQLQSQHTFLH